MKKLSLSPTRSLAILCLVVGLGFAPVQAAPAAKAKAPVAAVKNNAANAKETALKAGAARVMALTQKVDIPFTQYRLDNGLRVIVHTDRKAPVVAVQVRYHVGSKDEPEGKTGFAHLFEHLMFQGSQHVAKPDDLMDEAGVTDNNGTTNVDRTNYYDTVPTAALDRLLFIQSDRMGFLVPAITQQMLDEQRGVVQNEKREGMNRPFGQVWEKILKATFPAGHPYSHTTIGSMEDLDAASLDDVKQWFQTWYGPNNAVIVLSGDIDGPTALAKVQQYFGAIPPGSPVSHVTSAVSYLPEPKREVMQDRVTATRIYKVWPGPRGFTEESLLLNIGMYALASNATSRLDQALVRNRQLALGVSADVDGLDSAGLITVSMDVRPGVDPAEAEAALDAEIAKYIAGGPTQEEVQRYVVGSIAGSVKSMESVAGKAEVLAECAVSTGDPGCQRQQFRDLVAATPEKIRAAMRKWMLRPNYVLTVNPFGDLSASGQDVDRSKVPDVGDVAGPSFPLPERASLSNGIKVIFAKNSNLPTVNVAMSFDAGYVADERAKAGLAALTFATASEGTTNRTIEDIDRESDLLGTNFSSNSSMDRTYVYMNTLTPNLEPSLALWSDMVRNPAFPKDQFERLRKQQRAAIMQEANQPRSVANRYLWPALLGTDHPYGRPTSANGSLATLDAIKYEDLPNFYHRWIRPEHATIYAVGDTSLVTLMPLLEKYFGTWQGKGEQGVKIVKPPVTTKNAKILLIDKPEAVQSFIYAGSALPLRGKDDLLLLSTANEALGGGFLSRINSNLREEKGWSYGASSGPRAMYEQAAYIVATSVQTDKTVPALQEILREMRQFLGPKPITANEYNRIINSNIRSLAGAYDSGGDVLGGLISNHELGRPDDYQLKLVPRYKAMTTAQMDSEMRRYLNPDNFIWVIVGDKRKIEADLRAANIAPVELVEVKN